MIKEIKILNIELKLDGTLSSNIGLTHIDITDNYLSQIEQ